MIGRLLDGRYRVIEPLAKGGFGHTYIAQDTRRPGNPTCVVKHLQPATNDPNFLQTARHMFSREAETLEKLGNHDQIPRLLAYFEENEEFFLVQEFIDGHPLALELSPNVRWNDSQAIELLQEVLTILEFVHGNEVIHRDLKPQNLIRRNCDNKLVLVDFGAVKQIKMYSLMAPEQLKNDTVAIGTPGYMPSEQAQGRPRPNSDIYALGIIGIQALTGLSPKQLGEDPGSGEIIWRQHAQVSDQLATILNKMVHQYYKYRYQSATEVLQVLDSITNPNTPTAVASVVNHVVRSYLRDGYVSANKIVLALQELAKPCYVPSENTKTLGLTQPPDTLTPSTLPVTQNKKPNRSPSIRNLWRQPHRKGQLLTAGVSAAAIVVIGIMFASPPSQTSSQTAQNEIQAPEPTEQPQDQTAEKNNCIVVVKPSNLRSTSGRRRTGKVVKAGTRVTVTGRKDGGWIEISQPESGWIWKSRTKNTCSN